MELKIFTLLFLKYETLVLLTFLFSFNLYIILPFKVLLLDKSISVKLSSNKNLNAILLISEFGSDISISIKRVVIDIFGNICSGRSINSSPPFFIQ